MGSFASFTQFWSDWGLRICVLGSLAAYVFLGILSRIRRRRSASRLPILDCVLWSALWLLYQLAEIAAMYALGSMALCGARKEEQQLVAFWAPFLLVHLGGPDNMIAYTVEDSADFTLRKWLEMYIQVFGIIVTIWNYIYRVAHSRLLFVAAVITLIQGWYKFAERTLSSSWMGLDYVEPEAASHRMMMELLSRRLQVQQGRQRPLDNGEALLLAQDMFLVWRLFLMNSPVGRLEASASEKVLTLDWRSMCMVVEMEMSLMYDVLYTKALSVSAGQGYVLRFMSPVCTAVAAVLFWLHRGRVNKQEKSHNKMSSFVYITWLLLGTSFALDVVWLLRALGSTWTYDALNTKVATLPLPRDSLSRFRHQALRGDGGWWHRLHGATIYLDPLRLAGMIRDPVAYRRWSGTIGQYNLLRECSVPRGPPPFLVQGGTGPAWQLLMSEAKRKVNKFLAGVGLRPSSYMSVLPEGVKEVLFQRVQQILSTATARRQDDSGGDDAYTMDDITTCWGQATLGRRKQLFEADEDEVELPPKFGRVFDEDVIAWHIATCIFLSRAKVRKEATSHSHSAAIEVLSDYLMFLVVGRRKMLSGHLLHGLLYETRTALKAIWENDGKGRNENETLATLLRRRRNQGETAAWAKSDGERLVSDATAIAGALTKASRNQRQVVQMLDFVFDVWVDKLLYAAIRCSKEYHAMLIGSGGELATVMWILVQHAVPFRIGRPMPASEKERQKKESHEKQQKQKKKQQQKQPAPAPHPAPTTYPWPASSFPDPDSWQPWPWPQPGYDGQAEISMIPSPSTEGKEHDEDDMPVPEDEEDPDDARDYNTAVEYITLY